MSPATVLLSSPPDANSDELRKIVASAGFAVADHLLGSAPAVDFGPVVVAVVDVGERPAQPAVPGSTAGAAPAKDWTEIASAQTRRWRAELGDQFVPVLWVASAEKVTGGL